MLEAIRRPLGKVWRRIARLWTRSEEERRAKLTKEYLGQQAAKDAQQTYRRAGESTPNLPGDAGGFGGGGFGG